MVRDDAPIRNFVDGVTPWRPVGDREPNPFEPENLADFLAGPIPPREWLLGTLLCREYVTVLAASGGSGKTALNTVWALSLASGRPLVGLHVHKRCRVLVLTFEDGRTEYRRRFKAACLHHNIDPEEIGAFLFIKSLNGLGVTLATSEREGVMVETDAPARIMDLIKRLEIDAVTLDPFVKCSGAPENDNVAVDAVARILARIAEQGNVAVAVSHHFRKGVAEAGNIDSARGARSLIDAARIALTLMPMSPEEADKFGIAEDERCRMIRLDDGKVNLAPAGRAKWYRLVSVNIDNGTADYPHGDNVQTVEQWTPPDTWAGLSNALLNRILDVIEEGLADGERYSGAPSAKTRAAWLIVQKHAPEKTEAQCRAIIKAWLKSQLLRVEEYDSRKERKRVEGLRVDPTKRPGTGAQ